MKGLKPKNETVEVIDPQTVNGGDLTFNITSQYTESLSRRKVRNLLLRRRSNYALSDMEKSIVSAILLVIDEQINGFYTLDDFTWAWDIHPNQPLKVITPMQWDECGGGHDAVTGMRYPAAFTRQEK